VGGVWLIVVVVVFVCVCGCGGVFGGGEDVGGGVVIEYGVVV